MRKRIVMVVEVPEGATDEAIIAYAYGEDTVELIEFDIQEIEVTDA